MGKHVPDPKVQAFADAAAGLVEMGSLDATWRAKVVAFRDGLTPGTCDNV